MGNENNTEKEVEKVEVTELFKLVQVPTQHEIMIQSPTGELIDVQSGIVMLLNKVEEIRNLVG